MLTIQIQKIVDLDYLIDAIDTKIEIYQSDLNEEIDENNDHYAEIDAHLLELRRIRLNLKTQLTSRLHSFRCN